MSTKRIWWLPLALSIACNHTGTSSPPAPTIEPTPAQGDVTPRAEPTAGFLMPDKLILGRETDVVVTFHDTMIDVAPEIDLGPGITSTAPSIVSPTTIYLHLLVSEDAPVGKRDVVVHMGQELILTFKDGLEITPAVHVTALANVGEMAQGSIAGMDAVNLDGENEFVCAVSGGIFSSSFAYFLSNDLYSFGANMCSPDHMTGTLMWAPLAAAAPRVDVMNGYGKDVYQKFIGEPVVVKPRDPIVLQPGSPLLNQQLDVPYATALYRVQQTGPAIVSVDFVPTGTILGFPDVMMFGAKGTFDDLVDWPWPYLGNLGGRALYPVLDDRNSDLYIVYFDGYLSSMPGNVHPYDVRPLVRPVDPSQVLAEVEPNDGADSAQALDIKTPLLLRGTFDPMDDVDSFKLTLAVGQKLDVVIDSDVQFHWKFEDREADSLLLVKLQQIQYVPTRSGEFIFSLKPTNPAPSASNYTLATALK